MRSGFSLPVPAPNPGRFGALDHAGYQLAHALSLACVKPAHQLAGFNVFNHFRDQIAAPVSEQGQLAPLPPLPQCFRGTGRVLNLGGQRQGLGHGRCPRYFFRLTIHAIATAAAAPIIQGLMPPPPAPAPAPVPELNVTTGPP